MDSHARKKAIFRAKLKEHAQKQEKRIESPLVRYNEFDQPVCRVCDVILKSESLWPAHQASRKHHEAINNLKATAAGRSQGINAKPESSPELPNPKSLVSHNAKLPESREEVQKPCQSSSLPADFFDNHDSKKKKGLGSVKLGNTDSVGKTEGLTEIQAVKSEKLDGFTGKADRTGQPIHASSKIERSESNKVKGALPEGFFDNKEADLRARGIEPVKLDVKDEYKEFEKLIQEDLKEVDDRLEEEEFDAAEMIEGTEFLEQKACIEKVELLKKKKMEREALRSSKRSRATEVVSREMSPVDESSSDGDSEQNFAVDWRAKHL